MNIKETLESLELIALSGRQYHGSLSCLELLILVEETFGILIGDDDYGR